MNGTKRKSGVHGLLVSGTDQQLLDFHMPATMLLNFFARRANTVHCACMHEDFEFATKLAEKTGVTLQEIELEKDEEVYKMIVQGQHPGWKREGEP
jgi:glutaredoxin